MKELGNNIGTFTCYNGLSEVTLASTQTETLTLTPTSGTCTLPSSGGGGGGGGGGGYTAPTPVATPTVSQAPAAVLTSTASAAPQASVPTAAVSATQAATGGFSAASRRFTVQLKVGAENNDVKQLQEILVREEVYPEGIISGYFGSLTKKAVQRFQEKYGIAKSADVGYGEVGPNTRAKLNQLLPASPVSSPASEQSAEVKAQIQLLQSQLEKLLAELTKILQSQVQEIQGR